jgi:hypothetical protein
VRTYVVHIVAGALLALGACRREAPPTPAQGAPVFDPAAAVELAEAAERARVYGDDGELLESDVFAGGVKLPRGLREEPGSASAFVHTFETNTDFVKLIRYFGPRVLTGNVERRGGQVIYRNAVSRDAPVQTFRIDLSIAPIAGGKWVVEIRELRTEEAPAKRTLEEANRLFEAMQKKAH